MPLIVYVPQIGSFHIREIIMLIPIVFAVFVNLLGVHWADRDADASVGKKTLVVSLGNRVRIVHAVFIGLIYGIFAFLIFLVPLKVVFAIFFNFSI